MEVVVFLALAVASAGALQAPRGVRETAHEVVIHPRPPFVDLEVTITLENRSTNPAEADLHLPLLAGAAVVGLDVERQGAWEAAAERSAAEANAAYSDVVHPRAGNVRPVAAATSSPESGGVRVRIFPVPGDGRARLRVRAVAPLDFAGGSHRFEYPGRRGDRLSPAEVSIAGSPAGSAIRASGPADPVEIAMDAGDAPVALHAATAAGAGTWIAVEPQSAADQAVDVVVLLDRSASMQADERQATADDVARRLLLSLPEGSRAGAITFAREPIEEIAMGDPGDVTAALGRGRWQAPPSGSDLGAALLRVAALLGPAGTRARYVVVVSDAHHDESTDGSGPLATFGLPDDVQVSALCVAACASRSLVADVVARRGGVLRCDLARSASADRDRAVHAVVLGGTIATLEVGAQRLRIALHPGEQTRAFVPSRGTGPREVRLRMADGTLVATSVRHVPPVAAPGRPRGHVWVDGADLWASARLRTGRAPAGGSPPGSGIAERASRATRPAALAPDVLQRVLRKSYLPAVRGCFLRHGPGRPSPVPVVVEGRVREAEVSGARVRGAEGALGDCLRERLLHVIYPWAAGEVRFRYPITWQVHSSERSDDSGSRASR